MDRRGSCLCGAVTFTADVSGEASACHCGMCRRWSGGPFLAVGVASLVWEKSSGLKTIASSEWAERGFCGECGSSIYYRITAPGPYQGVTSVALGTFDDQSDVTITKEWYIDRKPAAYTLAGERKRLTEAEIEAMFSM
jgi:hypothetical protein